MAKAAMMIKMTNILWQSLACSYPLHKSQWTPSQGTRGVVPDALGCSGHLSLF